MTEKKRKKAFNRNINHFKSCSSSKFGILSRTYGVDLLKERQEEIIAAVPISDNEDSVAFDQFEMQMRDYMQSIINEERKKLVSDLHKTCDHYRKIIEDLQALGKTIATGACPWESQYDKNSEWGGAGVIITSDPDRSYHEGDIVLVVENPAPVVWIMETLRDVCDEYIDYSNKYSFYGMIAETAQTFFQAGDTAENFHQDMLLEIIKNSVNIIEQGMGE